MKSLCLFDLDGTLTDSKEGITKSVSYALKAFGVEVDDLDSLERFIGPPLADSFRDFYGFSQEDAEKAVDKYRERYAETGIYENAVYDGVIEMLETLADKGIEMVIATSKPTAFAERIAGHFSFGGYFSLIAGSEMDGSRCRKSEVISYALSIVDPGRNRSPVMIGDRSHDIIGARETGIESIGAAWGYGLRGELEKAGATWIAQSPKELPRIVLQGR